MRARLDEAGTATPRTRGETEEPRRRLRRSERLPHTDCTRNLTDGAMATAKKSAKKAAKQTTAGVAQDRRKVASKQAHEVAYESEKMRASPAAVKKAIEHVGNVRKVIESRLKKVRAAGKTRKR